MKVAIGSKLQGKSVIPYVVLPDPAGTDPTSKASWKICPGKVGNFSINAYRSQDSESLGASQFNPVLA